MVNADIRQVNFWIPSCRVGGLNLILTLSFFFGPMNVDARAGDSWYADMLSVLYSISQVSNQPLQGNLISMMDTTQWNEKHEYWTFFGQQ